MTPVVLAVAETTRNRGKRQKLKDPSPTEVGPIAEEKLPKYTYPMLSPTALEEHREAQLYLAGKTHASHLPASQKGAWGHQPNKHRLGGWVGEGERRVGRGGQAGQRQPETPVRKP